MRLQLRCLLILECLRSFIWKDKNNRRVSVIDYFKEMYPNVVIRYPQASTGDFSVVDLILILCRRDSCPA